MTPDEHRLIIAMFQQQAMYYSGLLELLKSRGFVDRGDLQALDALVSDSLRNCVERNVEEDYLGCARILGIDAGF